MNNDGKIVAIMAVGPGESGIAIDNIKSMRKYCPEIHLVVIDDCTQDGSYDSLLQVSDNDKVTVLRNADPCGYVMLINTLMFGLRTSLEKFGRVKFFIKLDSDVGIVGPGLGTTFSKCFEIAKSGLVGIYKNSHLQNKFYIDMLPIGPTKTARHGKRWSKIRLGWPPYLRFLPSALKNKYILGESIFGPCYALHGSTVDKLIASGFVEAVSKKFDCASHEDDTLIPLGVKSVGDELHDVEKLGFPNFLHLPYMTPPLVSPEELMASGVAVCHSLKHSRPEMVAYRKRLIELRENTPSAWT